MTGLISHPAGRGRPTRIPAEAVGCHAEPDHDEKSADDETSDPRFPLHTWW